MRRDSRGRIMLGDPLYGHVCDCGNLKGRQARRCRGCYRELLHDDGYWQRRTCPDCRGPKSRLRQRCLNCANERQRGRTGRGQPQPADHPWRKARL